MRDPAFLLYSSDFLTGCSFLNFEERGKYITILCQMHQHGRLTEESIRFLVGSVSVSLMAKFSVDETGKMYNKRLEIEIDKRAKFVETRRNNGLLGGRPKSKKTPPKPNGKPTGKPKGKPTEKLIVDVNENEIKDEILRNKYIEFLIFRKSKHKTVSEIAAKKQIDFLLKYPTNVACQIIEKSIMNDWVGLFPLKENEMIDVPIVKKTEPKKELPEGIDPFYKNWI